MKFSKYHALGNAYIVVPSRAVEPHLYHLIAKNICHKNFGIGSDGLLVGPSDSTSADFGLRIFNPDGSEAEKSGNGLRIYCRFLWDLGLVQDRPFTVETKGGVVIAQVLDAGNAVKVAMGTISFSSNDIPVLGPVRDVLLETINIDGHEFIYSAVTIGNPHCVILHEEPTQDIARHFGPKLEVHPSFPHRTNVQFVKVIDRNCIKIEIWERGAGYTLASGSSSCAAAAVVHRLGLCDEAITVHMPGGEIQVEIAADQSVTMLGSVTAVCTGEVYPECLEQFIDLSAK